jgi:nitrate reductase gamma subunit
VSRVDWLLWIALPYLAVAAFVVGHVWRWRRDQFGWTARSTQLLERRLLLPGSVLFHAGILLAIGGHVLGILVPASWTDAVGISHDAYHWLSVVAGGSAGLLVLLGLTILAARRLADPRVRATTLRSDWVLYPVLWLTVVTGVLLTLWSNAVDEYPYRETVSPWFRGLFALDPDAEPLGAAPFVVQAHLVASFVLFAIWPFTRLVHAWSVPLQYLLRPTIPYRARGGARRAGAAPRRAPLR